MNIGMVCYASVGGSGVVATELGRALAQRGHRIHLISSDPPFRWRDGVPGLFFEKVQVPSYPLFREPQYLLALTNTIVRVAESSTAGRHPRSLRGAARHRGVSRTAMLDVSTPAARRRRSRPCTAPTSRWLAATRRIAASWHFPSNSRTA